MPAEKILRPELQEALDGLHDLRFVRIQLASPTWNGIPDGLHGEVFFDDDKDAPEPDRRWTAQVAGLGVVMRCMSLANALVAAQEMFELASQQDRELDEGVARRRRERNEALEAWRERVTVHL